VNRKGLDFNCVIAMAEIPTTNMEITYNFPDFKWFLDPLRDTIAIAPISNAENPARIWIMRRDWKSISSVVFFQTYAGFQGAKNFWAKGKEFGMNISLGAKLQGFWYRITKLIQA
jgi:hypothetical protein